MANGPYDYIIIGSGSGAGPLILRLSQNPSTRLLVLEAGPDLPTPLDRRRQLTQFLWDEYEFHNWKFRSEPSAFGAPPLFLPQGRLVGGTTHYASGYFVRGTPSDHAEWDLRLGGNSGWGFTDVLPFYRRVETDLQFGNRPAHGNGGPVEVYRVPPALWKPVDLAFAESAQRALGVPVVEDQNDPLVLGTPALQAAVATRSEVASDGVRRGCRQCGLCNITPCKYDAKRSTLVTYVALARSRANVEIRARALVDRIRFNPQREAVAVEYLDQTGARVVVEGGEILLCAGAYGSPAILMRSGIGPADHLRSLGIPVVEDLPGVGAGLQDHPGLFLGHLLREEFAPHIGFNAVQVATLRSGVARSTAALDTEIDLQLIPGHFINLHLFPVMAGLTSFGLEAKRTTRGIWRRLFGYLVALVKPRSEGRVRLRSADPRAKPIIDLGYFTNPLAQDLQILWTGFQRMQEVLAAPPLRDLLDVPLPQPRRIEEVPFFADTYSHPTRTCRMGADTDPDAVCDPRARVRGVRRLRVVDASIMPSIPRANTNLPTLMVGERVSDFILTGAP